MKTDEERRKKLFERIQKIEELKRTGLKNQLMVEQFMDEFLDASGKKHNNLKFDEKAKLCQDLKPAEIEPPIWRVLTAVNRLRNKIAHSLDHGEIQAKVDEVRAAYLAALEPTRREEAEQLDDARIVASACLLCCDNLFQATEAAQARKKRDA